jgi:ATP-binding cassette subfamily F protein 1
LEERLASDDPAVAKLARKEARHNKREEEKLKNGGLTKKELKALKKKEKLTAEFEQPTTLEGTFDVVQSASAADDVLEGATDISATGFSIRAAGKVLFENTTLTVANGMKYGIIGPNGHGKTTLLRHIAERKINYPSNIDSLLCEQEVEASDMGATRL